jgi:hypothetical protein
MKIILLTIFTIILQAITLKLRSKQVIGIEKSFQLKSKKSGKCVGIDGGFHAMQKGSRIVTWECDFTGNQRWTLSSRDADNNVYSLINWGYGTLMDVEGESKDNGAILHLWTDNNTKNQQFKKIDQKDGSFALQAMHSEKCVDTTDSTDNGVTLVQKDCNYGDSQLFTQDFRLSSKQTN